MIKKLEGHKFPVRGLQVLYDGNLASCSEDNSIIIWASKKLEVKHTFISHSKAIWCCDIISSDRMVTGSEDKTIKVWNYEEGKLDKTLTGHRDQVRCIL